MKIRKNISKLLGLSLFITNFSLYPSMATSNNEIPNRYETLEGEYITIDDSTEGEIKNIEILGNTIQNEDDLSDIKSVGDKVDGKELYEIPVLATGKNLINVPDGLYQTPTNGAFCHNVIDFVKLKPNTTYTISGVMEKVEGHILTDYTGIAFILSDKPIVNESKWYATNYVYRNEGPGVQNMKQTITTTDTFVYLGVTIGRANTYSSTIKVSSIQLEEASVKSEYEPYKEDRLTILSPTPLEKVGDVADRIICRNGVWGVEKNIKEYIFNGEEAIVLDAELSNKGYTYTVCYNKKNTLNNVLDETDLISNKFNSIRYKNDYHPDTEEFRFVYTNYELYAFVPVSEFNNLPTTTKFKEKVASCGTFIKYVTSNPQFIPLPNSQQIKLNTFLDKTHIFSQAENGVNPTLKVTVDRLNKMALDATTEAENNPTIDNLNTARNLVNHMDESNLKEQLQQRLNEITNLNDLLLERKNSTSNVDIYIKSENMLSMTLSTNSITFEDYSGVDDLEQSNTIKISINSSLPYQLNSYLVSEIQNADGGKIIDKDRLNIKDNSDTDYKEFTAINNKLILKDNCLAGNDLSHYIDLKLNGGEAYPADIYKTIIKFEAEQK